jgi:hypothetical protein
MGGVRGGCCCPSLKYIEKEKKNTNRIQGKGGHKSRRYYLMVEISPVKHVHALIQFLIETTLSDLKNIFFF